MAMDGHGADERESGHRVWQGCLARLQEEVPAKDFDALIRPLQANTDLDVGSLVLWAPNRYVREHVEDRYLDRIAELVTLIDDRALVGSVEVRVGSRERLPGMPLRTERRQRSPQPSALAEDGKRPPSLNPAFTFVNFVEGKSNQFAKAAASQVAESPGESYNPLLLYGGVGLGKTHLVHAVGNQILATKPQAKVVYLQSERFANDMVRGIRSGNIQDVMLAYRSMDVLLIDDIQFFAHKTRTQEEFFHVFNAVIERRGQVILTSDEYPRQIPGLDERLKSRFVGGMTSEVEPPDLETRVAILQTKAEAEGVEVGSDVAFYVAERIRSNVRELEGALRRVLANAQFSGEPVTIELVNRALRDLFTVQARQTTVDHIQKVVANYYNIKHSDMLSKRRTRAIARPRQVAMSLAKQLTNHSLPEIGERFGGRDHTTVLYACEKIATLRQTDADIAEDYKNLSRLLNQ